MGRRSTNPVRALGLGRVRALYESSMAIPKLCVALSAELGRPIRPSQVVEAWRWARQQLPGENWSRHRPGGRKPGPPPRVSVAAVEAAWHGPEPMKNLTKTFQCKPRTIYNIWHRARQDGRLPIGIVRPRDLKRDREEVVAARTSVDRPIEPLPEFEPPLLRCDRLLDRLREVHPGRSHSEFDVRITP